MPIYAYKCQGCGHQLEKIQRLSDAPLTDCPKCNQPLLKKQITAAAFKLTGTGWYETDFKNKNQGTDNSSTSKDDSSKNDKSTAKSDSSAKSADNKSQASATTKSNSSKDAA